MITESYFGLQNTSDIIKEKSVLYAIYKYLEVQDNTQTAIFFVLVSAFVLFLSTYLSFKGKGPVDAQFSTFEYQYMFITTSAYLHGYKPSSTIFAFLTFVLVTSGVIIFRKKYVMKENSTPFRERMSAVFKQMPTRQSIKGTLSWARESVASLVHEDGKISKQKSRLNDEELHFSANKRRLIIFCRVCCEYLIQFTNIFFSFGINAAYIYLTR